MAENNRSDAPLKVLIADDELLVRKGLRMTVDWSKYGMRVVADAPNGSLGWERFLEHRPQIVITDIVMPELDGIQLAKKIKSVQPETKILFLSCYNDFSYAKEGIRIGISDFILKTSLDDSQMEDCLARIQAELRNQGAKAQRGHSPFALEEAVTEWLADGNRSAAERIRDWLARQWKRAHSCGYVYQLFINGTNGGEKRLGELLRAFPADRPVFRAGQDACAYMMARDEDAAELEADLARLKRSEPGLDWRKTGALSSPEQWLEKVHELYRWREIERRYPIRNDLHREVVLKAIDYIERHLDRDLRASEIAHRIGVSRSYFSTIFKETTGESLISFITNRKLEQAKRMLRTTSFRLDDIAEQVGIGDTKYFAKWFKKGTSMTPGQYRHQTK
jgi:two-component system response regulator YesN